jgi:starch phosphorylase
MVEEYCGRLYAPAARRTQLMREDGLARAKAVCDFRARVKAAWPEVKILSVSESGGPRVLAGQPITVSVDVQLGALDPADVSVDAYYGRLRGQQAIGEGRSLSLVCRGPLGEGRYRFEGSLPTEQTGGFAYAVRVLPRHEALPERFATRLLSWH